MFCTNGNKRKILSFAVSVLLSGHLSFHFAQPRLCLRYHRYVNLNTQTSKCFGLPQALRTNICHRSPNLCGTALYCIYDDWLISTLNSTHLCIVKLKKKLSNILRRCFFKCLQYSQKLNSKPTLSQSISRTEKINICDSIHYQL